MNKVHFETLTNQTLEFKLISCPKLFKDLHAALDGYTRIKPIKRTRKRQIAKAKHMMAWHDRKEGGVKAQFLTDVDTDIDHPFRIKCEEKD